MSLLILKILKTVIHVTISSVTILCASELFYVNGKEVKDRGPEIGVSTLFESTFEATSKDPNAKIHTNTIKKKKKKKD